MCTFCQTRMPAAALAHSEAGGWQCTDLASCSERAAKPGIYSQSENELQIASLEAHQGAVTR